MIRRLKEIYNKLHILQNIYIKEKYFIDKKSYSMDGEDLEIIKHFEGITSGYYVDAGCYHPLHLSNTYLLYKKNWRGINIDLSKFSIDLFNYMRPEDININVAISSNDEEINCYYQKDFSQLTTTKKKQAEKYIQGIVKEKKIKSNKLTTILNNTKYKNRKIDFLNIDLEGADIDALKSLDFKIYRPKVICIEIYDSIIEDSEIYTFLIKLSYIKKWSGTISHIFVDGLKTV